MRETQAGPPSAIDPVRPPAAPRGPAARTVLWVWWRWLRYWDACTEGGTRRGRGDDHVLSYSVGCMSSSPSTFQTRSAW